MHRWSINGGVGDPAPPGGFPAEELRRRIRLDEDGKNHWWPSYMIDDYKARLRELEALLNERTRVHMDVEGSPLLEDGTLPGVPPVRIRFTCGHCLTEAETVVPWSMHHCLPDGWATRDAYGGPKLPRRSEHIFGCSPHCCEQLDIRWPPQMTPRWFVTQPTKDSEGVGDAT